MSRGVDHLLLGGATVKLTKTPEGQDANSILQAEGVEALRALVETAEPADLSANGEAKRLGKLVDLDYERERKKVAQRLDIRVGVLDKLVSTERPKPEQPVV